MFRLSLFVGALLFCVPTFARAADDPQAVQFDQLQNGLIFLNGTLNGEPTAMMLDSGAEFTCIDQSFADKLGLKTTGRIKVKGDVGATYGRIATGITVKVGSLTLQNLKVAVVDLAPLSRAIGQTIPMVLGRDAFRSAIVTIDFPHRRIAFQDRSSFHPPLDVAPIRLREVGKMPVIPIEIGNTAIDAELDLGDNSTILLATRVWQRRADLAKLPFTTAAVTTSVSGDFASRTVVLPSVTIAGKHFHDVPAHLSEDPRAGLATGAHVGTQMLQPFVVVFDLAGGSLYLEGPSHGSMTVSQ